MTTYVITGANRGIGLEICRQLITQDKNNIIYAVCRTASEQLKSLGVNIIDGIDVVEQSSIDELKK